MKKISLALGGLVLLTLIGVAVFFGVKKLTPPVKVGLLHSLSGTMAISETVLKDVALMTFAEINKSGGVLGRKIEPVVKDPASDWPKFALQAEELLLTDKVAVTFGCWTSVSRKHVLPAFEDNNGLLFYPVQYEGQELSRNVFYTGAAPNQQAIPAVDYLLGEKGGAAKRFVLIGTDYVYPRTTNKILRAYLISKGIPEKDILEEYKPFGFSAWGPFVKQISEFASTGVKTAVVSTVNGDSNTPFYEELARNRLWGSAVPVVAFSVGEQELSTIQGRMPVGHLAAWNYFMSIDHPKNVAFVSKWRDWLKSQNKSQQVITNDPMEATYIGIYLWKAAVEKAGSFEVDKVREAMKGLTFNAPTGMTVKMDETNHHLHRPVYIGEIQSDGQFKIVSASTTPIRAQPWSQLLPESAGKGDAPQGKTTDAVRKK
jgi:urea transport system substrate-binding protein